MAHTAWMDLWESESRTVLSVVCCKNQVGLGVAEGDGSHAGFTLTRGDVQQLVIWLTGWLAHHTPEH